MAAAAVSGASDAKRGVTLLLAGTPAGTANVGEIILRDLVRHWGPERVRCVAIVPPGYRSSPDPGLSAMPVALLQSDFVLSGRGRRDKWGAPASHWRFRLGFEHEVVRLMEEVLASVSGHAVVQVFAVLNNAVMLELGRRVAAALGVPLKTLVWDHPDYWLQLSGFDRWTRSSLRERFQASLAASERIAVVSETMQQDYAAFAKAPIQLLRHGIESAMAPEALPSTGLPEDEWVIGFAGSMYSDCAWNALLGALDGVDWRIAGRPVRLKVLAARIAITSRGRARIDYLGFRPPEEVQTILANCHLTYMPQPFVAHLHDLSRYSFPTKLTNYLALGRPVLVHAPPGSALAAFYDEHPIGALADSLAPATIVSALTSLLGDDTAYDHACRSVRMAAESDFTDKSFHAAIDAFLGDAHDRGRLP